MASNDGDAPETALAGGVDADAEPGGRDTPYGAGLAAGVAAWLVGYLAFYLRYAGEIRNSAAGQALEAIADGGVWRAVGWVFFNGQFVTTNVDVPFLGTNAMSFLRDGAVLPYLAAPVLLVVAGVVIGYVARTDGPGDAAVTGLLLVPGYLALSVAGVFLFSLSGNGASVTPDPVTGVLLAGLVYPAVFGAIGSLAGDLATDR